MKPLSTSDKVIKSGSISDAKCWNDQGCKVLEGVGVEWQKETKKSKFFHQF